MNTQTRPDILLIVLDTLRADRLSCYGYPRQTSPHIDEFARGGVLFEQAISPAQWTIPAHASIFTGEYPTTHRTTQIYDKLSQDQITLAQALHREGYHTVGFCNNVLLGVVENDLDRGFEEFYNYAGTVPNRPPVADSRPRRASRVAQHMFRALRRMATPIQDAFARSNFLLRIAFHPWVILLWERHMNSKGNTAQSLRDLVGYLRTRWQRGRQRPLFAFVNLMETHLPYRPRARFIRQFAPYYGYANSFAANSLEGRPDACIGTMPIRQARAFMRRYNREYYRWLVPLVTPFNELQDRVLNDMYDAEIACEDHLLRPLFHYLGQPEVGDNTLVIVTSDHGEGLNHHHLMGHSLMAYDDLTHVPLIVRYPRLYPKGVRVSTRVSTRRIFHTILQAAGVALTSNGAGETTGAPVDVEGLSLARTCHPPFRSSDLSRFLYPATESVFAEAYAPETLIALMESRDPVALQMFRCRLARHAIYRGNDKLITVDGKPDELFDVAQDPGEQDNMIEKKPETAAALSDLLIAFQEEAKARRPSDWACPERSEREMARLRLEEDEKLARRLRGLGYLE